MFHWITITLLSCGLLAPPSKNDYPRTELADQILAKPGERLRWDSVCRWNKTLVLGGRASFSTEEEFVDIVTLNPTGVQLEQSIKVRAPKGSPAFGQFGRSVAISDSCLLVGYPLAALPASSRGLVQVYEKVENRWELTSVLEPSPLQAADSFGARLLISEDVALIGAPESNRAYVFERTAGSWQQTAELAAAGASAAFGRISSCSADCVCVQNFVRSGGTLRGELQVFTKQDGKWTLKQTLLAQADSASDAYGLYSAILGDTLIVTGAMSTISQAPIIEAFRKAESGEWVFDHRVELPANLNLVPEVRCKVISHDGILIAAPTYSDTMERVWIGQYRCNEEGTLEILASRFIAGGFSDFVDDGLGGVIVTTEGAPAGPRDRGYWCGMLTKPAPQD